MSKELVRRLRDKHKHSAEAYGCEEYIPMAKFWQAYADLSSQAADLIESQAKAIEEMRGCLERIAFDGISDREKLTESAREYIEDFGGKFPNDRTLAAYTLYTLASHSKEGEQG